MKKTLYLAGPIHGADDPVSWRQEAEQKLSHRWTIIDPLTDPTFKTEEELIQFDLRNITRSHAVLARADVPSWGTAMEIFYAYRARVVVYAFGAPTERSPWLSYHVKRFYPTLNEAIKALQ